MWSRPASLPPRPGAALLIAAALATSACAPPAVLQGRSTPAAAVESLEPAPATGAPAPAAASAPATTPAAAAPTTPAAAECPPPRTITQLPRKGRFVALTFDDGPSPDTTMPILDILDQAGIKATFFDIGDNAAEFPAIQREVARRGHVIANHTWSHPWLPTLTDAQLRHELDATTALVTRNTGRKVCFVRPPMGGTNARIEAAIAARGQSTVMWQGDTNDWRAPGVAAIVRGALTSAPLGESVIVLLHDAKMMNEAGRKAGAQTVAALPQIIQGFKARGYTFVQVDGTPFPPG